MLSLSPYRIQNIELKNRIVMPPMCMYSSVNGFVQPFHLTHYGSRAIGGVGMVIIEATAVSPEGRITDKDLGIWDDQFIEGLQSLTQEIHRYGSKAFIQLAHAGRKSMSSATPHIAPSAVTFSEDYVQPVAMDIDEIMRFKQCFINAATRALKAGFDGIEIHAAHGYLIHEFMSPLSNHREDDYGGSFNNRARLLRELITELRSTIGKQAVLQVRISATDYDPEGITPEDIIAILEPVKEQLDFVHVSSGGNALRKIDLKPMYQVPFSRTIKDGLGLPTIAVGIINTMEEAEAILVDGDADLIAFGRELLRNPYITVQAYAKEKDLDNLPEPYLRAFK